MHSPYLSKIIPIQSTLPEYLQCSLTIDETCALQVPSPEDLIVILLLRFRQCPRDPRGCATALDLIVLLERLLEIEATLLLLKLRQAGGVVRSGSVGRKEGARHHLQPRVYKARRLWDEGAQATASREPCRLRREWRQTRGAAHETIDRLLRAEEAARLSILLRLLLLKL